MSVLRLQLLYKFAVHHSHYQLTKYYKYIHSFNHLQFFILVKDDPKTIPGTPGARQKYSLEGTAANHRAPCTQIHPYQ